MIIISDKQGQLGNRLFVFANFVAFATEHNLKLIYPGFEEYACYFDRIQYNLLCVYPSKDKGIYPSKRFRVLYFKSIHYLVRLLEILHFQKSKLHQIINIGLEDSIVLDNSLFLRAALSKKLLFCKGWRYRSNNFRKYSEQIRVFFTPRKDILLNVNQLIVKAKSKADIIVGVHIRQGDYKKFQGGKFYYELEAYVWLMKQVQLLFEEKKVLFIVCSNQKQDFTHIKDLNILPGNNHFVEDLYTFASCDYLIGPPSTYTMWASFYGKVPLYMVADVERRMSLSDFKVFLG